MRARDPPAFVMTRFERRCHNITVATENFVRDSEKKIRNRFTSGHRSGTFATSDLRGAWRTGRGRWFHERCANILFCLGRRRAGRGLRWIHGRDRRRRGRVVGQDELLQRRPGDRRDGRSQQRRGRDGDRRHVPGRLEQRMRGRACVLHRAQRRRARRHDVELPGEQCVHRHHHRVQQRDRLLWRASVL